MVALIYRIFSVGQRGEAFCAMLELENTHMTDTTRHGNSGDLAVHECFCECDCVLCVVALWL